MWAIRRPITLELAEMKEVSLRKPPSASHRKPTIDTEKKREIGGSRDREIERVEMCAIPLFSRKWAFGDWIADIHTRLMKFRQWPISAVSQNDWDVGNFW